MSTTTATGRPHGQWFKSSYSQEGGTSCVEACPQPDVIHIRDSKCKDEDAYDVLTFTPRAWAAFADRLQ